MCIRPGGIFLPVVYGVIVTSSTMPFSAIFGVMKYLYFHKQVVCLVSYLKSPKLQELLSDCKFKPCKSFITFLETDSELSTTEFRQKRIETCIFL